MNSPWRWLASISWGCYILSGSSWNNTITQRNGLLILALQTFCVWGQGEVWLEDQREGCLVPLLLYNVGGERVSFIMAYKWAHHISSQIAYWSYFLLTSVRCPKWLLFHCCSLSVSGLTTLPNLISLSCCLCDCRAPLAAAKESSRRWFCVS